MASTIMHLSIADEISKQIEIKDINRFRIGSIITDAYMNRYDRKISHFKDKIENGSKVIIKLREFREKYADKIVNDDLYLGYYMHLIQDILYRQFVYGEYNWNPRPEGNVARLHKDYALINSYLIEKYDVSSEISIPSGIEDEEILNICSFNIENLMCNLKSYFIPYTEGDNFFFTNEMADEYIQKAIPICVKEIEALRKGSFLMDEVEYAWKSHDIVK